MARGLCIMHTWWKQGALWKRSRQCLGQPMTHCIGLTGLRITVNLLQKTAFDVPLK
ncbi:hypothetical protein OIU77_029179, partial [Salix suchowensis]